MRITLIGSGNVATHLALALYNRGHAISQVWSRDFSHAQLLAGRVEAQPINDINRLNHIANVYIMAVSDDAIFELVPQLHLNNALVLHTSGATSMQVLKSVSSRYGVLWSPQTFVRDVAMDYSELPCCIEGCDAKTEDEIADLIGMVTNSIYRTTQQQRLYLHLASVFVNNFTNGLYAVAQDICKQQNIPFDVLYTLISTTSQHVRWGDVRYQMTGPAVRHDTKTIDSHRRLLADNPNTLAIYDALTKLIQDETKNWQP